MTEAPNREEKQAASQRDPKIVRPTISVQSGQGSTSNEQNPKSRKPEGKESGTPEGSSAPKAGIGGTRFDPFRGAGAAQKFNDKSLEYMLKLIGPISRFAAKGILALAVLTGFAEKKTETQTDKEPPKATLNVGTLGVTVAKVKINNGDKTTDFDANMPLAKAAREVVGQAFPQSEQDKFFVDNPIEKGVFGKKAKEVLAQHSAKKAPAKDAKTTVPATALADKLGKDR